MSQPATSSGNLTHRKKHTKGGFFSQPDEILPEDIVVFLPFSLIEA